MSKKAAEHHRKASEHLTHAARHNGEAAKHHEAGSHEKAVHHAHPARGHAIVSVMTSNHVTPFEVFKSFVEFYPKLGATIALGTIAAAARMIPTNGAAISDTLQTAKGPELVSPANISSPRKRSTAHKTPRKAAKRATGRRKAA
jgi:hypothetical protein